MEAQPDFRELLELFNAHDVDFVIVGGYALAFHGAPRSTGDMDILVRPDPVNARRVMDALSAFGFGAVGLSPEDFASPDKVVQLGYPPVRIDILTSISGVSVDEAFAEGVKGTYGGVPVTYLGRDHFVRNKRASGRIKDLADVEALGEAIEE